MTDHEEWNESSSRKRKSRKSVSKNELSSKTTIKEEFPCRSSRRLRKAVSIYTVGAHPESGPFVFSPREDSVFQPAPAGFSKVTSSDTFPGTCITKHNIDSLTVQSTLLLNPMTMFKFKQTILVKAI